MVEAVAIALSVGAALAVVWVAFVLVLLRGARRGVGTTAETARLLPDVVRLIARLARDRSLPRGVRVRLWLLLGYLASPVDVIPDFIPVVGFADDVIVVALTLRAVVRRAGPGALDRHWPGTTAGLEALRRLAGLR